MLRITTLTIALLLTTAVSTASADQNSYFTGNMRVGQGSAPPLPIACAVMPLDNGQPIPATAEQCQLELAVWQVLHDPADSPGALTVSYFNYFSYYWPQTGNRVFYGGSQLVHWSMMVDLMAVASRMPSPCRYDGENTVPGRADGVFGSDWSQLVGVFGASCTLPTAQDPQP